MRDEFIASTVAWLNRRVAPEGVTVDADTRLFDAGVVDSLGVLRLIAWTERAIGRRIDDREVRMDRFATVRVMAESFVTASAGTAQRPCAAAAERRCVTARACGRCGPRQRVA